MRFDAVRRRISAIALALAVAVSTVGISPPVSAAAVAQQAAGPTTSFETWFDVEQPPTVPFEAVQLVVDFPVGSRVARHIHGGPGYITMLDGAMTMGIGADPMRAYAAGESFVEPFRVVAEGANLTPAPASLLVTYLIPVGSAVTTLEGASALPAGRFRRGRRHASSRGCGSRRRRAATRLGTCSRRTRRVPGASPRRRRRTG